MPLDDKAAASLARMGAYAKNISGVDLAPPATGPTDSLPGDSLADRTYASAVRMARIARQAPPPREAFNGIRDRSTTPDDASAPPTPSAQQANLDALTAYIRQQQSQAAAAPAETQQTVKDWYAANMKKKA